MDETKKIYIGNLPYSATEEELRQTLQNKGVTPKEVKIINDKFSGRSKGFGFAEFETEEDAKKAIAALDGQDLSGRALKVNAAKKQEERQNSGENRRYGNFRHE